MNVEDIHCLQRTIIDNKIKINERLLVMPVRLRLSYWMRHCPKMALKTVILIVGPLLWLLYLYSTNYIYVNQRHVPNALIKPFTHSMDSNNNGANGDILRRPTVPFFEGLEDQNQMSAGEILTSQSSSKDGFRTFQRGEFTVMSDAIPRKREFARDQSVTLTTHATYELLDNVIELSQYWAGPISVAVYAPNTDFRVSFDYALWLRHCYTHVADYVSFYFIYPALDGVVGTTNKNATSNFTRLKYSKIANELKHKHGSNESSINCKTGSYSLPTTSFRHSSSLPYPINVCRNVARLSATTRFILASDIELYPSANVISLFLTYSKKHGVLNQTSTVVVKSRKKLYTGSMMNIFGSSSVALPSSPVNSQKIASRKVFVLPIFEVDKSAKKVPRLKKDLVQLYREKKAVYFHKHVCSFCNIIPRLNKWLTSRTQSSVLDVFMTVKRHRPFNRWEPIYIGTNDDPLFDERFTWEGQQDKMTQMYELCLLNYDLAILDSAFLVHRPGIKMKNVTEYKLKSTYIAHNNKVYKKSIWDLEKKYGMNPWCK